MIHGKSNFSKGFFLFLVLSLLFNLLFAFLLDKQAEHLASDLLHLIPTGIFNEMAEAISPTFPDLLFLIPIGLTDGVIGGFVGLILGRNISNNSKGIIYTLLIMSFAIFEFMDYTFIPIFAS